MIFEIKTQVLIIIHGICIYLCSYESGRISQHGDADRQCGISVNKAVDEDNGKWKCQVTSIDASGNAVPATREVDVTVASK